MTDGQSAAAEFEVISTKGNEAKNQEYWNFILSEHPDAVPNDDSIVFLRTSSKIDNAPLNRNIDIFDDQMLFIPVLISETDRYDAKYFNIGEDFESVSQRLDYAKQEYQLCKLKPRQVMIDGRPISDDLSKFYAEVKDCEISVHPNSKVAIELGYEPIPKESLKASIVAESIIIKLHSRPEPYHVQFYAEGVLGYWTMANYKIRVHERS